MLSLPLQRALTGGLLFAALLASPSGAQPLAFIANFLSDNVSVIDTTTLQVIATIPVGDGPQMTALHPDGSRLYVALLGDNTTSPGNDVLAVIDTHSLALVGAIGVGDEPFGVIVTPDGSRLYVTNFNGNYDDAPSTTDTVSVVDTATGSEIATIPVGDAPLGLAISPDGNRVYVANLLSDSVSVIDTATNTVVHTICLDPDCGDSGLHPACLEDICLDSLTSPFSVVVQADGSQAWVSNFNLDSLSVIDAASNSVVGSVDVLAGPEGMTVTSSPSRVWVANRFASIVTSIDTDIDPDNPDPNMIETIPVGSEPIGGGATPEGDRLYVADATDDEVTVIDVASGTLVLSVAVETSRAVSGRSSSRRRSLRTASSPATSPPGARRAEPGAGSGRGPADSTTQVSAARDRPPVAPSSRRLRGGIPFRRCPPPPPRRPTRSANDRTAP